MSSYTQNMITEDVKVYLAGPMRGKPRYNFDAFAEFAAKLRERGFRVWSPHEDDLASGFDPDKDVVNPGPEGLRAFMAKDLPMVCAADLVAIMPGWEDSKGTNIELTVARMLDIPVYEVETLLEEGVYEGILDGAAGN